MSFVILRLPIVRSFLINSCESFLNPGVITGGYLLFLYYFVLAYMLCMFPMQAGLSRSAVRSSADVDVNTNVDTASGEKEREGGYACHAQCS